MVYGKTEDGYIEIAGTIASEHCQKGSRVK